jgi:FAD synthetase
MLRRRRGRAADPGAGGGGGGGGDGDDGEFVVPRPRVIYFQHADEFPEVLSLLRDTVDRYDLDMIAFEMGVTYVEGLRHLVERNRFAGGGGGGDGDGDGATASPPPTLLPPPYPLAFVLGTRRDDPNAGSQGVFAPSSSYMPPFLRCNPIIDWDYGDVWEFLRHPDLRGEVPYCSLYDRGYTSLGKTMGGGAGESGGGESYWPAYMLKDWSLERAGRDLSARSSLSSMGGRGGRLSTTSSSSSCSSSSPSTARGSRRPSVGLIVIGDEILKGMTPDSNIVAAAKALRSYNASLARVSVISDDMRDIVNEIRRYANEEDVDFIVTSGGVGPTHDDVTIKSVAEALGLGMEMNNEMA